MFTRRLSKLLLVLCTVSGSLSANYDKDHGLFSAYPGADIERAQMYDYERLILPVSLVDSDKEKDAFTPLNMVGDLYRHQYEIENVSSLKVYENYVTAAKKLDFKPLFSCELAACGTTDKVKALGNLLAITGNVYNSYSNPYYWIGEKTTAKGKIVVAWFIGTYEDTVNVQQVIVEEEPLETGLIKVDAAYAHQDTSANSAEPLSADEKAKDHLLLPRYPSAKIYQDKKVDTEVITIPFAMNATDKTPLKLTGDLARHTYTVENVSSLKVYENYKAALAKAGFNFISQCELNECGNGAQVKELGNQLSLSDNVYNWYHNPYYLLATKNMPRGNVYVALFIGAYEAQVGIQQIILEEKAVQTGLVNINADELKQQIDAVGKAMIYGIYFDTGKAEIKAESKPTLDVINELLTRNPGLLLYVVGHTDDTGERLANVALSKQRAEAVVAELIKTYQIAVNRLDAQGVGPYVSAANNISEDGKQKNRRVELVSRLR